MSAIVVLDRKTGEPVLDSRVAARELGVEHQALRELIEAHEDDLGSIRFETGSKKQANGRYNPKPERWALLTEKQALLLITLVRNTDEALAKKKQLVDAFLALRSVVIDRKVRRELTDVLRDSGEYDRTHGHAYSLYTDMIYRVALGMDARHYREATGIPKDASVRENLTAAQLVTVERLEKLVSSILDLGADYAQVKAAIEGFGRKKIGDGSVEARELAAALEEERR